MKETKQTEKVGEINHKKVGPALKQSAKGIIP